MAASKPHADPRNSVGASAILPYICFILSLTDAVHLSVSYNFSVLPASISIERGTDQHGSSLVKKDGMCHATAQNGSWSGAHPALWSAREPGSRRNREWHHHRPRARDCALVPLAHLRPWAQKEPAPDLVLPEPPAPGQWRSKPTGDRERYLKRTGGCPTTLGRHALPRALVSQKNDASLQHELGSIF